MDGVDLLTAATRIRWARFDDEVGLKAAVGYRNPYSHLHDVQRYALVVAVLRLSPGYYGEWNSRLFGDHLREEPTR